MRYYLTIVLYICVIAAKSAAGLIDDNYLLQGYLLVLPGPLYFDFAVPNSPFL